MSKETFEDYIEKYDEDLGAEYNIGDFAELTWGHQQKKIDALEKKLAEAVKYLKIGKQKFAPYTTNSDVDLFLKSIEEREAQ